MREAQSGSGRLTASYYADKAAPLQRLFGANALRVDKDVIVVDGRRFPVVDDVIICLAPTKWPASVGAALGGHQSHGRDDSSFAEDVQYTFGEEWKTFSEILPEHRAEFEAYFSLVDLRTLHETLVVDLGCGIGRWSHFVAPHCRSLVLVDFSDAIFVARRNLAARKHAIFVMADITELPFAPDAADFLFCLGVLHHLPVGAIDMVRRLKPYAARLLIYLYYALDNRPFHYRVLLVAATALRTGLARVRVPWLRAAITSALTVGLYVPLIALGYVMDVARLGKLVPLYEGYRGKGLKRIRQDVYDRFFTRIEQRVTRDQIRALEADFARVTISPRLPYWTFLCER